jgi:Pentapeptide repeats (8 copies)
LFGYRELTDIDEKPHIEGQSAGWGKIVGIALAIAFAIFIVVGLFASSIYSALDGYLDLNAFSERKDLVQSLTLAVQALAVVLTGTAGLIGIYFTWRNLNQSRKATEDPLRLAREEQEQTQKSAEKTLRVTEKGQVTERFSRAIEQLGAMDDEGKKRLGMRLGGIYALERIATYSPEKYYSTVMEVLAAYVRENAPLDSKKDAGRNQENRKDSQPAESVGQDPLFDRPKAPADIQVILDVLQRLKRLEERDLVPNEQHMFIDLKESNLSRAKLMGANLSGANLSEANLFRADLSKANLSKANLATANLPGATLFRADLSEAFLFRADLSGAFLTEANLSGAFLFRANLSGAILFRADLSGADLSGTENLKQAQLERARGNATTCLPSGFKRPESWIEGDNEPTNQNDRS